MPLWAQPEAIIPWMAPMVFYLVCIVLVWINIKIGGPM
jgi:hypothetical protein